MSEPVGFILVRGIFDAGCQKLALLRQCRDEIQITGPVNFDFAAWRSVGEDEVLKLLAVVDSLFGANVVIGPVTFGHDQVGVLVVQDEDVDLQTCELL